jgi:hypothetical protein
LGRFSTVRRARAQPSVSTSSDGSIILGVVIVLFFKCMVALLNPVDPRAGPKWPYVAHVVTMFSFVTVMGAMTLRVQSSSLIDHREFRGGGGLPPGPIGYYFSIYSKPVNVVPKVMFLMNNCLADGLLVSPISNQSLRFPTQVISLALSLLRYLSDELLDHRLPLPAVSRRFWYVLKSPQTNRYTFG